jgi:hypothetical protein
VCPGERIDAPEEDRDKISGISVLAQRRARDRLDDRELVLDAVVELAEEEPELRSVTSRPTDCSSTTWPSSPMTGWSIHSCQWIVPSGPTTSCSYVTAWPPAATCSTCVSATLRASGGRNSIQRRPSSADFCAPKKRA